MNLRKILTALVMLLLILPIATHKTIAQSQEPPIPVEVMFGHNQLYLQLVVKRKFTPESKFGFFTVATFSENYTSSTEGNSMVMPIQISYSIGKKGFGIMAGAENNSVVGFYPIFGPQHNFSSRKFLAVTVASLFLNEDNDLKLFGLYEYKPPINKTLTFFSRLQFIYNHNLKAGSHNRSYVYLRAGLKKGQYAFGLGANLDQLGPEKIFRENYGVFARWEFK